MDDPLPPEVRSLARPGRQSLRTALQLAGLPPLFALAYGTIWINCTHTDAKGRAWSAY